MSRIAGVIFDMDGVLIDSHAIHMSAWRRLLQDLGQTPSDVDLQFVFEGHKREEILTHFLGPLSPAEVQRYGELKDQLVQSAESELKLVAGVAQFISQLEKLGIARAVATSGSRVRTLRTLERMDLARRIPVVVTADDVQFGKPSPELFLLAAAKLGLTPDCLLVVEDAVPGIEAAKSAGMRTLGIGSDALAVALSNAGADEVVPNFEGLFFARFNLLTDQLQGA